MTQHDSDHYDIQFTTRQFAVLFGLLVVIVGGVFVGGIVIGRGMSPETARAIAARRQAPPPPASEPAAPAAVDRAAADAPGSTDPDAADSDTLRLPIPQAAAEPRPDRTPAAVSTSPDQLSARTLRTDPSPAPRGSAPAASRPASPPPAAPPSPVAPSGSTATGKFTIQVAAFRDRTAAERLLAQLAEKGIEGYLEGTPAGIFRVRVGRFESREAARSVAARLEREKFTTLVTSH